MARPKKKKSFSGVSIIILLITSVFPQNAESFSYTITGASTSFSSIAAIGTAPALTPQGNQGYGYATINIPFSFTLDPAHNPLSAQYTSSTSPTQQLFATNNGEIFLGSYFTISGSLGLCCSSCSNNAARVAVINCNGIYSSNIYYFIKSSSVIISYENVKFSPTSTDSLNAQAELFANGNVELRFGGNASLYGNECDVGIGDAYVYSCFGIPYGNCNSSGVCTSFPYDHEYLFGKYKPQY